MLIKIGYGLTMLFAVILLVLYLRLEKENRRLKKELHDTIRYTKIRHRDS